MKQPIGGIVPSCSSREEIDVFVSCMPRERYDELLKNLPYPLNIAACSAIERLEFEKILTDISKALEDREGKALK